MEPGRFFILRIPSRNCSQTRIFLVMKTPPSPKQDGDKKPLDPREDPLARDSRGKASREEVRKVVKVPAPRESQRGASKWST